jgi:hypothetical protein
MTSFTRRNPETGQLPGEEVLDLPPRAAHPRGLVVDLRRPAG